MKEENLFSGALMFGAIAGAMISKSNSNNIKPATKKIDKGERNKLYFLTSLLSVAIKADGEITRGEESEIDLFFNELERKWDVDVDFVNELKDNISSDLPFSTLVKRYGSMGEVSIDTRRELQEFLFEILNSDHEICEAEQAFMFKCELMFEGMSDIKVMRLIKDKKTLVPNDYIDYISLKEIKKSYPDTEITSIKGDEFYTVAPYRNTELVPFSSFFEESYATSLDAELINVARTAGAKRVTVRVCSKNIDSSNEKKSSSGSIGKAGVVTVDGKSNSASQKMLDMQEETAIEYTFEGNRPGRFKDWLGRGAKKILRDSKWLQHNDDLTTFVESCYGNNRAETYSQTVKYTEISASMRSASIAAKCKFWTVSAEAAKNQQVNSDKMQDKIVEYSVQF